MSFRSSVDLMSAMQSVGTDVLCKSRMPAHLEVTIGMVPNLGQVCLGNLRHLELRDLGCVAKDGIGDLLWCWFTAFVVELDAPVLLGTTRVVTGAHDEATCMHRRPCHFYSGTDSGRIAGCNICRW